MDLAKPAGTLLATGALAMAGAVAAQDSAWGYYEAEQETDGVKLMQAGVAAADGSQLIFKCDKPGKGTVVAVLVAPRNISPPSGRQSMRDIQLQFDGGRITKTQWRYFENSAMAMNTNRERTLPQFVADIANAKKLEVRLDPVDGRPLETTFDVSGAREAVGRIFERCKDDNPLS